MPRERVMRLFAKLNDPQLESEADATQNLVDVATIVPIVQGNRLGPLGVENLTEDQTHLVDLMISLDELIIDHYGKRCAMDPRQPWLSR